MIEGDKGARRGGRKSEHKDGGRGNERRWCNKKKKEERGEGMDEQQNGRIARLERWLAGDDARKMKGRKEGSVQY